MTLKEMTEQAEELDRKTGRLVELLEHIWEEVREACDLMDMAGESAEALSQAVRDVGKDGPEF